MVERRCNAAQQLCAWSLLCALGAYAITPYTLSGVAAPMVAIAVLTLRDIPAAVREQRRRLIDAFEREGLG